jgi:threonylcarbamoyladenosine tRNA methylthiotransferase MtaB
MSDAPRIITFGCRLNAFESEVIRGHARSAGLSHAVVVNTCAVTAEAERQARQAIRRARREHPTARIIVTGCAAQIDPARYAAMPEVDRVIGNEEKLRAESYMAGRNAAVAVDDIMTVRETASHMVEGFEGRARAFLQVQQGCDHRCTFCIIPFGRGNNRSAPIGAIVDQARRMVESAHLGRLRGGRGGRRADAPHCRGGAPDAAPAPLAAVRRRHGAEKDEAAPSAPGRGGFLPPRA